MTAPGGRRRATRPPRPAASADPEPEAAPPAPEPELDPTTPEPAPPAPEPERRPLRVVVTGGAGLVGRAVVQRLRERGDTVVALVRDPKRAPHLEELGAELEQSDLSDVRRLAESLAGADAAIHAAGSYRVGIPRSEHGAMWDANVGTTTRMLDAAEQAKTPRVVYVSTGNVYGNTKGVEVDETYRRDLNEGFLSWYDETKYGAHEVAEQRIRDGAPVVIAMPSQVYGPGDHSSVGEQLWLAWKGRLRYRAFDDVGFSAIHSEDVAAGIVAALDRGAPGERYNFGGPPVTLGEAVVTAARLGGHHAPRLRVPTTLLRASAPLGGLIGQPNLGEIIAASAGVTYWLTSAKAQAELGFVARDLEQGLRDTFGIG